MESKPKLHIQESDIEPDTVLAIHVPQSAERRCVLLTNLVRTLVRNYETTCPALVSVTLQLLDELSPEKNEIM
jgi:hypothetical protein